MENAATSTVKIGECGNVGKCQNLKSIVMDGVKIRKVGKSENPKTDEERKDQDEKKLCKSIIKDRVPSLITLDHGDLLVMDGLTQSEYVHCTASGLQGPRVNLTFRLVAQHIASCHLQA